MLQTELNWVRVGQLLGSCECSKEPVDLIQCGAFFDRETAFQESLCSIGLLISYL